MTNQSIIDYVVSDPLVREALTVRGTGGEITPPSTAKLQSMAARALQTVIAGLLVDTRFERSLFERTKTLTTTSATEYTLPDYVGRILNIKNGSDGRPLRLFNNRTDFDDWKWREHGDADLTDDPPGCVYVSGRGPKQQLMITFYPGVGSETTFDYLYTRRQKPPYQVDAIFPENTQEVVLIGTLAFLSGGMRAQQFEQLKGQVAHNVAPIVGGMAKIKDGQRVRRMKRKWRNMSSGGAYSWLSSVKD